MSLPLRFSLLLLLTFSFPAMAADSDEGNIEPSTPLRPESRAPVQWDVARAVSADVTCEGKEDTIVLGYQGKNQVWISVRRNGTEGRPLLPPHHTAGRDRAGRCLLPPATADPDLPAGLQERGWPAGGVRRQTGLSGLYPERWCL